MDPDTTQAPDGAGYQPTDLIPRAESIKAYAARDEAKARARELEARAQQLEAEVERLRNPPRSDPKPDPGKGSDDLTAMVRSLIESNAAIHARLDGDTKQKKRAAVVESILARVPAHNRELASTVVDGLVARGTISLDGEDITAIVDTAAKQLHTHANTLFSVGGSGASAIQSGPDGRIDWTSVRSKADVPPGAWAEMPDEVYKRLEPAGSSGAAFTIRGGR